MGRGGGDYLHAVECLTPMGKPNRKLRMSDLSAGFSIYGTGSWTGFMVLNARIPGVLDVSPASVNRGGAR